MLAAVEYFRELHIPRSLTAIVVFLYVCENEGLIVTELATATGLSVSIAARTAKILSGDYAEFPVRPHERLLELSSSQGDARLRHIYLTDAGRRVRDRLDEYIARAVPIRSEPLRQIA